MRVRTLICLLAMLSAVAVRAERTADFEYGPRPAMSVFDPGEALDPVIAKEISDPLVEVFRKEGVDVVVVVLKDMGNAPPEHVARQFSDAWCQSPIHCVVLHVPGKQDSPWIIPAGRMIVHLDPATVAKDVNDRQRRARSEPDDAHKVKAAAQEASDMLRYWLGSAILRSEKIQTESTRIRLEQEVIARKKQIAIFGALASIIPLVAGIALLIKLLRGKGAGYFPNPVWQLRLGAPHAGGNNAVVNLEPPKT